MAVASSDVLVECGRSGLYLGFFGTISFLLALSLCFLGTSSLLLALPFHFFDASLLVLGMSSLLLTLPLCFFDAFFRLTKSPLELLDPVHPSCPATMSGILQPETADGGDTLQGDNLCVEYEVPAAAI